MRRVMFLLTLMTGFCLALFTNCQSVGAFSQGVVTIQHNPVQRTRPSGEDGGAKFEIYDLTEFCRDQKAGGVSLATLERDLGAKDNQDIKAFISRNNLEKVVTVQTSEEGTARFKVNCGPDRVYLAVQTDWSCEPQGALGTYEQSMPIVFSMSTQTNELTLETKPVRIQRSVYFYKYAAKIGVPLQGAVFALHRLDQQYLTQNGGWQRTTKPLDNQNVLKVVSDAQGLVLLKDVPLPSGRYVFEELKAPDGYQITQQSRQINVVIPQSYADAVTVNGVMLHPLIANHVQNAVVGSKALRVYNAVVPMTPNKTEVPETLPETGSPVEPGMPPETGTPTQTNQMLPQTGNVKLRLGLLGVALMGVTLLVWRNDFYTRERK